ncbi:MAG: Serine--tRNA ligase, mitochondrial [Geoglossum simile]|nr:MAG: Serine--tRNA ligase, mitochondrial [Geoglossum simile]
MASIIRSTYASFPHRLCPRITRSTQYSSFTTSPRRHGDTSGRPSIAPKPTINIKHIRENPLLHAQNCIDRNYELLAQNPAQIIELTKKWDELDQHIKPLRSRKKILEGGLKTSRSTPDKLAGSGLEELGSLKRQFMALKKKMDHAQAEIERLALELPNLTSKEVPQAKNPVTVGWINPHQQPPHTQPSSLPLSQPQYPPPSPERTIKSHIEIGKELDLLDFEAASTATGWGWYYLKNEAALLEQALVQYALSVVMKKGWTVVSPPSIVYSHIAEACGFRPRDKNGEQQIYTLERGDRLKPELSLAGTAEIPLAAMKANKVISYSHMPIRMAGVSRCYRAEAGSRGVDTKGLYRVHEFTKVEMFAWAPPDNACHDLPHSIMTVWDEMLQIQSEILRDLNLHCRILEMPITDLGASASRKRDIEAYFPSRRGKGDGWGEVTSASICTDYQSRRLKTRVRLADPSAAPVYAFTANGTALAVPRVIMAILENGWDEERGMLVIPKVLRPWMGGIDVIKKKVKSPNATEVELPNVARPSVGVLAEETGR